MTSQNEVFFEFTLYTLEFVTFDSEIYLTFGHGLGLKWLDTTRYCFREQNLERIVIKWADKQTSRERQLDKGPFLR